MLTKVEIKLNPPDNLLINPSMGSLFQGVIMQHISESVADQLHQEGLRPYSQHLRIDRDTNTPIWCINGLNKKAWEEIILPMLQNDTITLSHNGCTIELQEKNIKQISYQQLADQAFTTASPADGFNLQILTPTSFKNNGQYAIYPEIKSIYLSLQRRWQTHAPNISLEHDNLIQELTDHTWIANYKLQMTKFYLEQTRIPAFQGSLRLAIKGPDMIRRIAALLVEYANWSGIGIKTAIGMGAVRTQPYTLNHSNERN